MLDFAESGPALSGLAEVAGDALLGMDLWRVPRSGRCARWGGCLRSPPGRRQNFLEAFFFFGLGSVFVAAEQAGTFSSRRHA